MRTQASIRFGHATVSSSPHFTIKITDAIAAFAGMLVIALLIMGCQPVRAQTTAPEARDAFQQGWEHYRRGTAVDYAKAVSYFKRAIESDPDYGRARAALAAAYWNSVWNGWWTSSLGLTYHQAREQTRVYQEKAMEEPTALTYQVAAEIASQFKRSPKKALAEAENAIALDANDPAGHLAMATALIKAGKPAEAVEQMRTAMRLDPQYPASYLTRLGQAQFAQGQFQEAATTWESAAARNADDEWNFVYLVAAYGHLGREADAKTAISKANALRTKADRGALAMSSVSKKVFRWTGSTKLLREGFAKAGVESGGGWVELISSGPSGYEVKGATSIDAKTAKKLHDRGVAFVYLQPRLHERIPGAHPAIWETDEFNEVRLLRIVGSKDAQLVLYAASGQTKAGAGGSAQAVTWGFTKVYFLQDGLLGWQKAGYPVEKSE